jgi:predicted PurR-regulated permease PerM
MSRQRLQSRRLPTPIFITPRVRWVLVGAAIVALIVLLRAAPDVLTVSLGGFALALVLSFPVRYLARFMPRGLAILATFFVLIGVFTLALLILVPILIEQLTVLIADTPAIAAWAEERMYEILNPLQERGWLTSEPETLLADAYAAFIARAQTLAQRLLTSLLSWATQIANTLFQAFGIIFVAVYLLADTRKLKAAFLWAAPMAYRFDARELWEEFGSSLSRYLSGLFVVIVIQGVVSGIALTIIGVPYAIVLGLWVAVTAILPYIGAWLGAIPAITVAAFISPKMAILTVLVYVGIQQLEGNVLTPRIQGDALRVHPILVFLAVIAGGQLAGLQGAIFAVPSLAVLRVLVDFFRSRLRVYESTAQQITVRRRRGVANLGNTLIVPATVVAQHPLEQDESVARDGPGRATATVPAITGEEGDGR